MLLGGEQADQELVHRRMLAPRSANSVSSTQNVSAGSSASTVAARLVVAPASAISPKLSPDPVRRALLTRECVRAGVGDGCDGSERDERCCEEHGQETVRHDILQARRECT
jgi:hypothetical protein